MSKPKVAVILPTIRENNLLQFLAKWHKDFSHSAKNYQITLYVVEDNPEKTFDVANAVGKKKLPYSVKHFCWQDIETALGKAAWIIPHRSDTVRSIGIFLAYQENNEFFITMDDDCYPAYDQKNAEGYYIESHVHNLITFSYQENGWTNSILHYKPRGYPYGSTAVNRLVKNAAISHGLWVNVPDFDAITALSTEKKDHYYDLIKDTCVASGNFYPMCSMNLAWRRDCTPMMYFLLMGQSPSGEKYLYDRFGDIWCGLFSKKILDHLHRPVVSGSPYIHHDRASSAYDNLIKEAPGIKTNEVLWKDLNEIELTGETVKDCYIELSSKLPTYSDYWKELKLAMKTWAELY